MLKMMGSILLLCGCFGVSLLQVKNMDKRVGTIRSLLYALEIMEQELSFRNPFLEEMLSAAVSSAVEPTRSFLLVCIERLKQKTDTSFSEIWNNAAREKLISLKIQDIDPVCKLGGLLGRYDREGQRMAIQQTRGILQNILSDAVNERKHRGKVYKVLGTTIGAFLVILLL